jgi:protoheme IX farnesyltransferase
VLKTYLDLTKFGIVIFVLLSGVIGYATGFLIEEPFDWHHLVRFLLGLYFLSSGSLALNQVQEYKMDRKMPRTQKRPIASGKLKPAAGAVLSLFFIYLGSVLLFECNPMAFKVGLASVVLYNVVYTMYLKRRWVYAAVPGAIPGALPVTIGYAAVNSNIWNPESVYLFLIMFLWQMPHFWVLAMKYKDDYAAGGVPVLPSVLGPEKTLQQIGLYTLAYVGVAIFSPWIIQAKWIYLIAVVPMGLKLLYEFYLFNKSKGTQRWLGFFLWTNLSMLVFLIVPVIDKWSFIVHNFK